MGRRSMDCLRASQLDSTWLQNELKLPQKLRIDSSILSLSRQIFGIQNSEWSSIDLYGNGNGTLFFFFVAV